MAQAACSSIPSELPSRTDHDVEFSVHVQFGQFTTKLDDGTCVEVVRKWLEWVVDYHQCTLESLEKDLAARVNEVAMGEVVIGRQGDAQECSSCIDWDSLEIAPILHNQVPQLAIDWDAFEIEPIPQHQLGGK
uniref:Uncharacterized protein n=1 Tax=Oryza glaberrima TaxID=4538 RepID=I1Q279_ORYGL